MDKMLSSRIGKLRIICSLPLFSDSICIKKQSAAEHGFTQILLTIALTPLLNLTKDQECDLFELAIFAELPKSYLGDPSFYLRQRHPDIADMYRKVRGRLWLETEESLHLKTTRHPRLYGLHGLIDAFSAMLYIEKECLLGNSYFATERYKAYYHTLRRRALKGDDLTEIHPTLTSEESAHLKPEVEVNWLNAIELLDTLYDEATRARLEGGIGDFSATFIGMMEKLKEHYRYKGWSYHFPESVGEHTFQVVFLSRLLASSLGLSPSERIELYKLGCLHDLAEAYASDVVYPVKMREKDLGEAHVKLEEQVINSICKKLNVTISDNPMLAAIVDVCDRFSAQIYFDREVRSGNTHFCVPNTSMQHVREKYSQKYPEIFYILDEMWEEYINCFK